MVQDNKNKRHHNIMNNNLKNLNKFVINLKILNKRGTSQI